MVTMMKTNNPGFSSLRQKPGRKNIARNNSSNA